MVAISVYSHGGSCCVALSTTIGLTTWARESLQGFLYLLKMTYDPSIWEWENPHSVGEQACGNPVGQPQAKFHLSPDFHKWHPPPLQRQYGTLEMSINSESKSRNLQKSWIPFPPCTVSLANGCRSFGEDVKKDSCQTLMSWASFV